MNKKCKNYRHLDHSEQNTGKHTPFYWRIPIVFGLWGGGLGGIFFAISLKLIGIVEILAFILLGAFLGFIPALITGLLAMLLKLERNILGIVVTMTIGALSSWIYGVILSTFASTLALIGGLSALILAFWVLPKSNQNLLQNPPNSE